MVKKLSDACVFGGRGGGGGGDDDEDEKRGAWGGQRPNKYINGSIRPTAEESEEAEIEGDAVEGQHLYLEFLSAQVLQAGLSLPTDGLSHEYLDQVSHDLLLDWTKTGYHLRLLADEFAQSPERQSVRERARKVSENIAGLDFDNFLKLLQELFQEGGVTRERILVLFFFCADVALEALRKGYRELFKKLIQWTLKYISTRVAEWVHTNGGWGKVLRSSLDIAYQLTACVAFVAVVCACVVYIRRNI